MILGSPIYNSNLKSESPTCLGILPLCGCIRHLSDSAHKFHCNVSTESEMCASVEDPDCCKSIHCSVASSGWSSRVKCSSVENRDLDVALQGSQAVPSIVQVGGVCLATQVRIVWAIASLCWRHCNVECRCNVHSKCLLAIVLQTNAHSSECHYMQYSRQQPEYCIVSVCLVPTPVSASTVARVLQAKVHQCPTTERWYRRRSIAY